MGREGEAVLLLLSSELSYVKLLEGRGVSISRTKLERCLSALPFEQLVRGGSEKVRGSVVSFVHLSSGQYAALGARSG